MGGFCKSIGIDTSSNTDTSSSTTSTSSGSTQTNQDRINEIYANSDNPWETDGAELNALLDAGRNETYTGGSTSTTTSGSTSTSTTTSGSTASNQGSAGTVLPGGQTSLGQVSQTGQYAGDGYVWVQNDNTNGLSRVRVDGDQFDNGLGTDVIMGGTAGNNLKSAIATVSLNEGTEFANSAGSATDGSVLDLFRDDDDKVGSDSFAEQVGAIDYTPTVTYDATKTGDENKATTTAPVVEKTFGETFAENRAAGNKTFEYKGGTYTTDLAPSTPTPAPTFTPTVSYDAFGNTYTSPAAAAEADLNMAQQAATANEIVRGTEESLFEQPVMTQASLNYLDDLGTDFDFTQFDTPSIDYTVSQGEAGRGGPDSAAPGFSYELPGAVGTSAKDADLGVGASKVGVTADDLATENFDRVPLDGGGNLIVSPDTFYGPLMDEALKAVESRGILEKATDAFFDDGAEYDRGLSDAASNMLLGGMDQEMERLLQIKNTAPETLTAGEYLRATDYEREKYGSVSAPSGTEVASPITATDVSPDLTFTNPRIGYESGQDVLQESADYLTGLDGSGPNTTGGVSDAFYGGTGAQVIPAVAMQDSAAGYTGANVASDLYRNITSGAAEEAKQTVGGAGTVFDEAAEALINSPAVLAKVFEQAVDPYAPYSQYGYTVDPIEELMGYDAGQIDPRLANAAITARDTYYDTDLIPRSQVTAGSEFVAPLKEYLGDVQASQAAKISPEMQKRQQDALPAAGTTIDDIINGRAKDRLGRPYGTDLLATGMTGAQESVDLLTDALASVYLPARVGGAVVMGTSGLAAGESGSEDAERMIEADFASGKLQQTPQFEKMVSVYGNDQAALAALKDKAGQRALVTAGPTGALGDYLGAKALTTVSPGFGNPFARAVTSPVIGGTTEGTEKGLTNIAARSAGADVARGQDVGTNFLLGLAGDATISTPVGVGQGIAGLAQPSGPNVAPTVDSKTYVPPAATTGQVAQVPPGVQTAYKEAAESMAEAGVRGVGDTGAAADLAPDNLTLAEQLMTQQLEDEGAIDVTELDGLGLTLNEVEAVAERAISKKMDSDNQMLQALADESVLETGGISEELVQEINDKLGPEVGAQVVENAVNRPFVSNEGKTRMEIMLENAKKAGETSVTEKPATGIETALGANTGLDIKTDSGLDTEQQLDFLFDDDDSQQLNLLDTGSSTDTTTGEDSTTDAGADATTGTGTDSTVTTDVGTDATTDTTTDATTDVLTTVDVPEGDDDDVVVDEDTTTTDDDDDDDTTDIVTTTTTTTDDDGNTITECPEGFKMVETEDGPMCVKTVKQVATRQRAGRNLSPYTRVVTRPGEGLPQRRKTSTIRSSTERVKPTTRSV